MNLKPDSNIIKKIVKTFISLIILFSIIFIWEKLVIKYDIPKRIIPKPSDILDFINKEFIQQHSVGYEKILIKALQSLKDALIGFSLAMIFGTLLGLILSSDERVNAMIFPILFICQIIPVPAFAPVIAAILGYGSGTKIFIITLFTLFPVAIAIRDSIRNIPEDFKNLFVTYNASKKENLLKLTLPSFIPSLLSVMKLSCTASIVASIITELPLSVTSGIGKDIYNSFNNQIIPRVWTSIILISLISVIFFKSVEYIEKYINSNFKYGEYV